VIGKQGGGKQRQRQKEDAAVELTKGYTREGRGQTPRSVSEQLWSMEPDAWKRLTLDNKGLKLSSTMDPFSRKQPIALAKTERKLIDNLTPSPALLSAFLLWGPSNDLLENVKRFNELFAAKERA
jgi:hypothetical protein